MNDAQKALQSNENFYTAFNRRDLDLMKSVWHTDPLVSCIHPGWEVLRGFETIIHSWENIFQGSDNLEIKLSDLDILQTGDLAWVSCQENLFVLSMSGVQVSKVHATNLFRSFGGEFKMILHHASSVPDLSRARQIGLH